MANVAIETRLICKQATQISHTTDAGGFSVVCCDLTSGAFCVGHTIQHALITHLGQGAEHGHPIRGVGEFLIESDAQGARLGDGCCGVGGTT